MLKNTVSLMICLLLTVVPVCAQQSTPALSKEQAKQEEYKKKVVDWGTNKNVNVKLKSGEKLKGRIAEIKDESFALQVVEKGKVTSRDVQWTEIKGLSAIGTGSDIANGVAIGVAAAAGTVLVLILIALANN